MSPLAISGVLFFCIFLASMFGMGVARAAAPASSAPRFA